MEWNRAKTILIFSFLVLNILLAYQLWVSRLQMTRTNPDAAGLRQEIMQILKEKGVQLQARVSSDTPKLREITVKLNTSPMKKPFTLTSPVSLQNLVTDDKELKNLLSRDIPGIKDFRLDPADSNASRLIMHQLYKDYPMFDVNLILYKHNGTIDKYQMSYVQGVQVSGQNQQSILSGLTAIGSLVENNHLPSGAVITDVQLGYHGQIFNSENQVLAPAWRIVTQNNGIFYVQAITGGVMSDQKEQNS